MAASVSQELIRIGVRAIVAAGWAVNDAAAEQFAVRLYSEMLLEDRQFGAAVHHARQHIFEHFAQTNTWGAYQCYGMPSFILGGGARQQEVDVKVPVAKHEVLEELNRLRASAAGADTARRKAVLADVRGWEQVLRTEWRTGDTLYSLAETYAALGEVGAAIDYFRQALASEEARPDVPIRAIEQLADLEARYAEKLQAETTQLSGKARRKLEAEQRELLRTARRRLLLVLRMGQTPRGCSWWAITIDAWPSPQPERGAAPRCAALRPTIGRLPAPGSGLPTSAPCCSGPCVNIWPTVPALGRTAWHNTWKPLPSTNAWSASARGTRSHSRTNLGWPRRPSSAECSRGASGRSARP